MSCAQPEHATSLCVSCGLCCNGVLYSNVKVSPDEVSAGSVVDQSDDGLQVRLPCRHHEQGRCNIYHDRFSKCRSFRCELLKKLDSGEVALPDALETVSRAKAMVARLAALDPELAHYAYRAARRRESRPSAGAVDRDAAQLWVESVALEMFLDRMFRNHPMIEGELI